MAGKTVRRSGALLVSVVVIAALATAAAAAPAVAAKPRCGGHVATIVGTAEGEVIRGTPGRDVIVAGGGYDIV